MRRVMMMRLEIDDLPASLSGLFEEFGLFYSTASCCFSVFVSDSISLSISFMCSSLALLVGLYGVILLLLHG